MDIEGIINNLSQQEKAALCSGRDFWHLKGIERFNIPAVMITDGPHGLRTMMMSLDGGINREMLDGILMMANGQLLKGLSIMLKTRKQNQ